MTHTPQTLIGRLRAFAGDDPKAAVLLCQNAANELVALHGVIAMAVARLGGEVEGAPTGRHNFLQRIDELRRIERAPSDEPHAPPSDYRKLARTLVEPFTITIPALGDQRRALVDAIAIALDIAGGEGYRAAIERYALPLVPGAEHRKPFSPR